MNITDSDFESDSPPPTTDDSESPAGTSTSRAPNMSAIPTNQPPAPSQSGMDGDGPSQYQTPASRSPSNPTSTAAQQSPTLAHRQVPGAPGTGGMMTTTEMLILELNRIPPSTLTKLKQDLGMPDKGLTFMTPEEKTQLVQLFRRRTVRPQNVPGPSSMPPPTQTRGFPPMGPPGARHWQTLQQQYQAAPIGRSTTNLASSAVQQGPSLAHRQVSGTSDTAGTAMTPEMLATELNQIPPPTLAKLKRKLGMAGKDLTAMTLEEQTKLVQLFRQGTTEPRNVPGPSTVPPGQQRQLPGGSAGRGQHIQPLYTLEPPVGQPRHPPLPPNSMMVQQGTIPEMSPMQHPTNPSVMQPGQAVVTPQMHQCIRVDHGVLQYRQAMQGLNRSQNMSQHITLATSPATTAPAPRAPTTSGTSMTAPPSSAVLASTPTMSNHPPPPPPPGPNPPGPDRNMFSLNFTEFTDLDPSSVMGEGAKFERDFVAWFNGPAPDDTHRP
ncbi:hypothetical protein V8D89_004962 [Ganoderma adspersum]